jgi:adenylate cyclase
MTEQRRLAAIVSADVAGYSRLMGRDESGTLAALKALRKDVVDPAIANHGGRIVKTTGDGLLLEFPSVVNAVRCTVEVQAAMAERTAEIAEDRRIAFRIGINLGDIIVEDDDIFGDGVNVAARLQEIAAPGGICISSRVHEDVRDRLDTAFDDGGTQTLKNIARPVQVWRWQPGTAASPMTTPLPLPDKPSIAVLPFQNMSGDPEQEYFVDGIAEDIITGLSRFRELFVIARNSSFTYKGRAVDVKQVGRELGVRHVLEGSSRKAGNRVRVTAQLIDCVSGSHLWAERYDRELVDIFAVQEEITRSIVSRIAPAIEASVVARARRLGPANLGAHDLAMRSIFEADAAYGSADPAMRDRAMVSARQALELDPDCVLAWVTQAWLCWQSAFHSQKERTVEMCQPGLDAARRAIELDRFEHRAYMLRGMLYLELRQYDDALADLRHACELNPSDARALQALGYAELMNGDTKLAKEHGLESLRLNPQDPMRHNTTSFLANACFVGEEYPEGLQWVAESRRSHPDFRPTIMSAIKLHVGLGQLDRARAEAERIRSPVFEERVRKGFSMLRRPEHRERELRSYRIALDLPEPTSATETSPALALPDKPSIAVLPFTNMSGDPEQEYFADGVAEDIITALSNFKTLFVIARNSSFTYKGKAIDVKQVGRELGVRYVLEGSVRKSAGRVRITGQLIEAPTGAHLWAERMDGELREVFDLQDKITARVVSSVMPTIERAEIGRLKQRPTNTTDSYDTYLRGMALHYQQRYAESRSLFKKAVEYDPEYAAAYAQSALSYSMEQAIKGIIPTPERRADALRDANTALGITTEDALVLARCSHPLAYVCQQFDRAAVLAERAVTLNPNLVTAWNLRGWISLMLAKPEQAIDSFEKVMRLSPLDPARPNALAGIAFGHFFLDHYDEGRRAAEESLQLFPNHQSFATYVVNCVGVADLAEATSAAAQFLKFDPSFNVSRASALFPVRSPELREKLDNALRSAGVPE